MNQTLTRLLDHRAFVTPRKICLKLGGQEWNYIDFNKKVNQFANYLDEKGYQKGDRIGILAHNDLSVPVLIYGALKKGLVPVQLNWWSLPADIDKIIIHAEIKIFFYGISFDTVVQAIKSTIDKEKISEVLESISADDIETEDVSMADDEAFHIYTSGTTGMPKGTILTHRNIIALSQNILNEFPGFGSGQVSLIAVPLFNIAGLGYLTVTIINGGCAVLLPTFDANAVIRSLQNDGITNIFLPPALIFSLCQSITNETGKFNSLKLLHYGGAPISASLLKTARIKFECDLIQGYGLTETTGIISLLRVEDHDAIMENDTVEYIHSAGKIVPGIEIKIIKEDGTHASIGEIGELYVKGDTIMKGYWKNAQTDSFENGWFKTGDFVRQDHEGYLYIVDRKNDLIITKGINVYPSEIEKILSEHELIQQVCVLGMPSEAYGDIVTAVVVCDKNILSQVQLEEWARGRLSGYKLPRQWYFEDELPRNLAGKVVRKLVKEKLI